MTETTTTTVGKVRGCFPDALEVYLLGEFNNWSTTATPLVACGNGEWETQLPLPSGLKPMCFFVWDRGRRFRRIAAAAK